VAQGRHMGGRNFVANELGVRVDGTNTAVIKACDFIGTDGYPYWQGSTPEQASDVFWQSVNDVRDVVNHMSPGKWVWVTETGWPVTGDNYGASIPDIANAQSYWKNVACAAFEQVHMFWYAYQDFNANPSFGILGPDLKPLYDLGC
ncbi:hypothetical protein LTS18_005622, partial [Coniosporium uncinatum]